MSSISAGTIDIRSPRFIKIIAYSTPIILIFMSCRKVFFTYLGLHDYSSALLVPNIYEQLIPNFINSGFVRRGLSGTIFHLFDDGSIVPSLFRYHIFCSVWAVIPIGLMLVRLSRLGNLQPVWLALILLASAQLFWSWGIDVGRSDLLVVGFITWAALFTLGRRYLIAAAVLVAGMLAHETTIVYGPPVCAAIWYMHYSKGETGLRQGAGAAGFLCALFALALLAQALLSAPALSVARTIMLDRAPGPSLEVPTPKEFAAYVQASGVRGIVASQCIAFKRPAQWLYLSWSFLTLALYVFVFMPASRVALALMAFSSLLPMAAMSVAGIDYGRWCDFAVFTGWLCAAGLALTNFGSAEPSRRRYALGAAALVAALVLGPSTAFFAGKAAGTIADHIWPKKAELMTTYLSVCDPGWRSVIGE